MILSARARDVATFEPIEAIEKAHAPRRIGSIDVIIEYMTIGASRPSNLSTVPMRAPGIRSWSSKTWTL
jgi:hypothetical protein